MFSLNKYIKYLYVIYFFIHKIIDLDPLKKVNKSVDCFDCNFQLNINGFHYVIHIYD